MGGTPTASQAADADSADSAALGSRTGVLALALIKVSRRRSVGQVGAMRSSLADQEDDHGRPAYAQTVANLRTTASGGSCAGSGSVDAPTSRRAPKPRAAAVVVDGDQVLVMKRHKRGRDYAVLPGGGVEEGETAAQAALRELHEETTLVAEIDRLLWTGRHNDRPAWYFLMTARTRARRAVRAGGVGEPAGQQLRAALDHRRPVRRARPAPARHPRPTRRAARQPLRPRLLPAVSTARTRTARGLPGVLVRIGQRALQRRVERPPRVARSAADSGRTGVCIHCDSGSS